MGKWVHRLSDKDTTLKTAVCKNCGPVRIHNDWGTWKCSVSLNNQGHKNRGRKSTGPPPNNDGCELCQKKESLVWDHDHDTGKFRGWLCKQCNLGLGLFKDDPNRLLKAVDYLKKKAEG